MFKKLTKKKGLFIAGVIVVLFILMLIVKGLLTDNNNYLAITDELISQKTGSFRYVFDVRSDKHSENNSENDASSLSSLENIEAESGTDELLEGFEQEKNEFVDWGNKEGVEVTNWQYPKYKLIVEGDVVSTEPLEMSVKFSLATNYFNDELTDIIVKDDKTYVNIEQLRYWLVNSKDRDLVNLGKSIPESSKYIVYEGDEFNLYSTFAEDSEVDLSRESDLVNLYNRFLIMEKTLTSNLNINKGCYSKDDDIYRLNITGEDSVDLLKSIKSMIQNTGGTYNTIISNQFSNDVLTEEQYNQDKREVDNIVSAFADANMFFSTNDLESLDLNVSGNARTYVSGKGASIYESSLAFQYTANDTDYLVAVQLYKSSDIKDVEEPTDSTVSIKSFENKDIFADYMLEVFKYLNIFNFELENKLELTPSSIKDSALLSFVDLVNQLNSDVEDFTPLGLGDVHEFIDNYRYYEITDDSSEQDIINSTLVSDFLSEFDDLLPDVEEEENTNASMEDDSRFPSLVSDSSNFRIYADIDQSSSNTRCIKVNCYILNKSTEELTLSTTDFSLRTLLSSKYPANYESLLLEYDNSFNMSLAPQTLTIQPSGYVEVPMYFIVSNGLEYMDLWYLEENLGVVISR